MNIIIANERFEKIALIETAAVIWHSCYYKAGDFEIYANTADVDVLILKKDYYVMREDDEYVGIIEDILISESVEEGEYITVTGRFSESILERRIIYIQTQINGTIENGLRSLINENVTNPRIAERKIDEVGLGPLKGFADAIDAQFTGENLLTAIQSICEANMIGFKMPLVNDRFLFEIYKGIDRSYNQSKNPYVVFSDKYDNLISSQYNEINSTERNFALIAGEGEGSDVFTATVGTAHGLKRKEIYVEASDVSSNGEVITDAEYAKLLKERGKEALGESIITRTFESEIDLIHSYVYKKDFNLGDIVTIENVRLGIYENVRIIEIIESEDEEGKQITPVFGA